MLNKQVDDPDVAGVGKFVEKNFYNLGLADHPLQALNAVGRNDPTFRDDGRREITARDSDAFKFRVLTLRQLKDARFFFHNGSFTSVKDVVRYFNAGVPQDAEAGAAPTLTRRFTHPRGAKTPRGLGLNRDEVDDLTDFIENGLYDPAFVHFDPKSPTTMFQLSPRDVLYSVYRPDLAALLATDGRPASGLPEDNDDPLSRRDKGLEFLDVTSQLNVAVIGVSGRADGADAESDRDTRDFRDRDDRRMSVSYRITNTSRSIIDTHLLVIPYGLSEKIDLENASGRTTAGVPYLRVFLPDGVLQPGQSTVVTLRFRRESHAPPLRFDLTILSGQGNP
jgi:hypothetical protein